MTRHPLLETRLLLFTALLFAGGPAFMAAGYFFEALANPVLLTVFTVCWMVSITYAARRADRQRMENGEDIETPFADMVVRGEEE